MALADILQVIVSEKETQILEMKSLQEAETKQLLEDAHAKGTDYSSKRFNDFEEFKVSSERKLSSDISREKRVKTSQAQDVIMNSVFSAVEEKLSSLSKEESQSFCTSLIRSIPEDKGTLIVCGTSKEILTEALKASKKNFSLEETDLSSKKPGFLFSGEGYIVDFTFNTLVQKELREKNEADLFTKLFS